MEIDTNTKTKNELANAGERLGARQLQIECNVRQLAKRLLKLPNSSLLAAANELASFC